MHAAAAAATVGKPVILGETMTYTRWTPWVEDVVFVKNEDSRWLRVEGHTTTTTNERQISSVSWSVGWVLSNSVWMRFDFKETYESSAAGDNASAFPSGLLDITDANWNLSQSGDETKRQNGNWTRTLSLSNDKYRNSFHFVYFERFDYHRLSKRRHRLLRHRPSQSRPKIEDGNKDIGGGVGSLCSFNSVPIISAQASDLSYHKKILFACCYPKTVNITCDL